MAAYLHCPGCGHDVTKVLETRVRPQNTSRVYRRRVCAECGARFTTSEALCQKGAATLDDIRTIATKLLQMVEAMEAPEVAEVFDEPAAEAPEIRTPPPPTPKRQLKPVPTVPAERRWCDQCEQRVDAATATRCGSRFCSLKQPKDAAA